MKSLRKDIKGPAGIVVKNSAIQSLANGFCLVIFDTIEYISGKCAWNAGDPGRVQAGEEGLYHLSATWTFEAKAAGIRTAMFYKNGNAIGPTGSEIGRQGQDAAAVGTTQPGGSFSRYLYLKAGEYVTMTVYQNSGGACNSTPPGMSLALVKVN